MREHCLVEIRAALPAGAGHRAVWIPSRKSFQIFLPSLGISKKEFGVKNLSKQRQRDAVDEAFLTAKDNALEFLTTCQA